MTQTLTQRRRRTRLALPLTSLIAALLAVAIGASAANAKTVTLQLFSRETSSTFVDAQGHPVSPSAPPAVGDTFDNTGVDYVGNHTHHAAKPKARTTCAVRSPASATRDPWRCAVVRSRSAARCSLPATDPLGHKTSNTYDADQNLASATDADGNTTAYAYDNANELTTVTRADGTTLSKTYDGDGNITSQTDGAGRATTYGYDALDRRTSATDPLNHTTTYKYDAAGNQTSVIDAKGRTTTYGYDAANRLTSISYSDGLTPNVTYGYENDGQRTSMTDGSGSSSYHYDSLHRLTGSTDGAGHSTSYSYDLAGNETGITYPNGKSVTETFDPANRLASVKDWLGNTTSSGYDPDSNLTSTTFPADTGDIDTYAYDATDQMSSINMSQGPSTLATLSYTRDPLGQVTTETQTGLPGSASTTYTYTKLSQLASAGANDYSYDNAGNITQLDGAGGYSYNEAGELTSSPAAAYAYDALGERTTSTPNTGNATTYAYDQAGHLTTYTPPTGPATTFAYNGDGLRTAKSTGTTTSSFAWNTTASIPVVLADGQNSYLYGPAHTPIEQISQSGGISYLHQDQLGSTRLITNENGDQTASFTYSPYGALSASTGTATSPIGYAGQYTDAETGLQYDQARYYDPGTGQFLTVDPLASKTGEPYAYANANPTNASDPTGLSPWGSLLGAAGSDLLCAGTWEIPGVDDATCGNAIRATAGAAGAAALAAAGILHAAKHHTNGNNDGNESNKCEPSAPPNFGDPSQPPGPGWEWRGNGPAGSDQGSWVDPKTGEVLHPDLGHGDPIGPHYDWRPVKGGPTYRVFPDGRITPK